MAAARGNDVPPTNGGGCDDDGGNRRGGRKSWFLQPLPRGLIERPLEFIAAEHHRQREAAVILHMIADGGFHARGVQQLIEFLETDFVRHIGDEELVFFPALKAHCHPEDNVDRIIARLLDEHEQGQVIVDDVLLILKSRLAGDAIAPDRARRMRELADKIRKHLALENGVLLPIARVRLDKTVLRRISDALKQRR